MMLSFVIPAHNEERYIGDCLRSILVQAARLKQQPEILVINNASTDNTAEISRGFPSVRVIDEVNLGTTYARKKGFEEARGELIIYLDADCRLPNKWIEKTVEEFKQNPTLAALSGPYRYYDLPRAKKFIAEKMWWIGALVYPLVGYMAAGGNLTVRRRALIEMEKFDTSITFYGDDTDMARRISKTGKVSFKMSSYVYTSGRRFQGEGLMRSALVYGLNFMWEVIFKKPYSRRHANVR